MTAPPLSLEEQAAAWVARMDCGGWDDTREAELQAWLKEDPLASGALLRAQAIWIAADKTIETQDSSPLPQQVNRRRFLAAGGAALIASAGGAGLIWLNAGKQYETEVGEVRSVPLDDGSMVTINTASHLEVALAASRRDVQLDRGEAWFKVAKDPTRPFVVRAGDVQVQAVGTAFAVHRHSGGAEVLVTGGVVDAWATQEPGRRLRLLAGQRAFVAPDTVFRIDTATASDVERALAWRNGKIELVGETLGDAAADFNRYNTRKIVIEDRTLADERFDGVFNANEPDVFAAAVRKSLDVPVDLGHPATILIGKKQYK